jgi:hypothetical protein
MFEEVVGLVLFVAIAYGIFKFAKSRKSPPGTGPGPGPGTPPGGTEQK